MTESIHEEFGRQSLDDTYYEPPYCPICGGEHEEDDCDVDLSDDDQYTGPTFCEDDS
jgi:hypothetical protein